ncbi:apolipoprotein N-acyltransferase [Blochmannia endosymbiont of Colobopsis nipponica]|uniref:apolipoprotein N-acyltransferase n=1 Tax=Blochmannia endosymbiont of Colobopsis nipponica TaxID=2681987 RepID=UPI00177D50A9|nr:apolipoprotein N-acyltransferase [Blochmannia endosymbiont of Colobopsis nipponica]QOI11127.1 apolipoprotein N-acyltransferase [Blochmannia endosymbiont of Colobopsis nipponica]
MKNNHKKNILLKTHLLLSLITGISGVFAFSPYNLWLLAFFSCTGLLMLTLNKNIKQAALQGFIWGIGFFGYGIHWVHIGITKFNEISTLVSFTITSVFIIYLAFYPALFSASLVLIWPNTNLWRLIIGAPVLWSITEFLRGYIFTGFPWLQFGYSQIDSPLNGLAPIFGVRAITFIVVTISGLLTFSIIKKHYPSLLSIIIIMLISWTLSLIKWYQISVERVINIALVQGNIDQMIKWDSERINEILNVYLEKSLPFINTAKIIIWPETAIPDIEKNQELFLLKLDQKLKKYHRNLITGIIGADKILHNTYYNSIIVIGNTIPDTNYNKNRYDKHHLVLLGEKIFFPSLLQTLVSFLKLSLPNFYLQSGKYLQPPLKIQGIKFTSAVCYEIIIGEQIWDNFTQDTDFILTISNNSWFGNSIEPWQHFQMTRMRALELGRPLLHCTNNGITAIINADGTLQKQLPTSTCQVLNMNVASTNGATPYAKWGYYPFWIINLFIGFIKCNFKKVKKS